jgi:hypothetical protein
MTTYWVQFSFNVTEVTSSSNSFPAYGPDLTLLGYDLATSVIIGPTQSIGLGPNYDYAAVRYSYSNTAAAGANGTYYYEQE